MEKPLKKERKHDLTRSAKRPQGRKMTCVDKYSRGEQEPKKKSMGIYEEPKKESTKGRSGLLQ
jgi:hypothetical protein